MKEMTITRLAFCNNRKNRTRSILVTVSICLTMTLLVLVSSFGYGTIKSQRTNAGLQTGWHYGHFRKTTPQQLHEMELRSEFDRIGRMALLAVTENDGAMYFADETALAFNNMESRLTAGAYPQSGKEIAAGAAFLEGCGLENPKVGDTVTLTRRFGMETPFEDEEYVISGILKENETGTGIYRAVFVSQEYYESVTLPDEREYNAYFTLSPSVYINTDNKEEVIAEMAALVGIREKDAVVNDVYLNWTLDMGYETIMGCALIIGCIVLFSVLVIYNIFQVGIVQKIQEYGKIRSLGATKKQMRHLIALEGMSLAAVGIPAGMICGSVISAVSFDWLMNLENTYKPEGFITVSPLSPMMLALSALVCLVTVWLALRRPMKLAASISPVEAIRYQEGSTGKRGRSMRKGRREMSVAGITFANLSAQKRRTVMTIVTMGLSCTLFVVLANLAGNMDDEYDARKQIQYGDFQVELDYSMGDQVYPENNLDSILKDNPLSEELLAQIGSIDGVVQVLTQDILYAQRIDGGGNKESQICSVVVMDRDLFEKELEEGSSLGEFSYDSLTETGGILWGAGYFMEDEGIALGDEISLRLTDGKKETVFESSVAGSFGMADGDWTITRDTYEALGFAGGSTYRVWIECEDGRESDVEEALTGLLAEKQHLELSVYTEVLKVSKMSVDVMKLICYALSGMIVVISFLNMANTLVVSAITRRQEFGMLQAIGMTNAQLNVSLQGEGLLFTLGTVAVAMLAGIPCGYGLFLYGREQQMFGLYRYHLPLPELLCLVVFLAVFQIVLSFVLTRNVKHESVIERIRYQG